jgi:hypothetical protein
MILMVLLILTGITKAQVIDDNSIKLNQNGNYEFTEGRFVAYLADTVSPTFIRNQFQSLEIMILDESIEPLLIALVNMPSKERLKELESHKNIVDIYRTTLERERKSLENRLADPALNQKQKKEIRLLLSAPQEEYIIEFDYSVDVKRAKVIMGEFRDVAYKILRNSLRTVTLKAESGNEPMLMDKVEQLPFVVSTAMIGNIRN